jgi:hypothetical protein
MTPAKRINISIESDDYDAIKEKAESMGTSISALLRNRALSSVGAIPSVIKGATEKLAAELGVSVETVVNQVLLDWWARTMAAEATLGQAAEKDDPFVYMPSDDTSDLQRFMLMQEFHKARIRQERRALKQLRGQETDILERDDEN